MCTKYIIPALLCVLVPLAGYTAAVNVGGQQEEAKKEEAKEEEAKKEKP